MSKHSTYRSDQEDFEKYFSDRLSEKARHDLESNALEDTFEAEAMEGWEEVAVETATADLAELRKRLQPAQKRFNWFKMAAAVALLMIAGVVVLSNLEQPPEILARHSKGEDTIAKESKSVETKPAEPNQSLTEEQTPVPAEEEKIPAPLPKSTIPPGEKVIDQTAVKDLVADAAINEPDETLIAETRKSAPVLPSKITPDHAVSTLDVSEMDIVESDAEIPVQVLAAEGQNQGAVRLRQESTGYEVAAGDHFTIQSKSGWNFRQIHGNVMDETGDIVADARIVLDGTPILAVSDVKGEFEMAIPDSLDTPTLTFSSDGFNQLNFTVNAADTFDVVLAREEQPRFTRTILSNGVDKESASASYLETDEEADFVAALPEGGYKKFEKYLQKNTRIPAAAKRQGINGSVLVSFQVTRTGELTHFEIISGLGAGCNEEAIRVIKEGPLWIPAAAGGEQVEALTEVEVRFN